MTDTKVSSFKEAKVLMADFIRQYRPTTNVSRLEIRINPIELIGWLSSQKAQVKIYGANQGNSAVIAGVGEALVIQGLKGGKRDMKSIFTQMRSYLSNHYPYMQWYGGFCFDDAYLDSQWKEFGSYRFVLPRFELASNNTHMIFCCNLVGPLPERKRRTILKELARLTDTSSTIKGPIKAQRRRDLPSYGQWERNVKGVLESIQAQELSKVVLARKTILKFSRVISPFVVFKRLFQVTPDSYHFCFQFGKTAFLGASPERLYKRQGRHILSEAIAGTSQRGQSPGEDARWKKDLVASLKDNREHTFVVEAINQSLKPLCKNLVYEAKPKVISLGSGHHLKTLFKGLLRSGVNDEDVLHSLHPTPAVAGAPRDKALQTIRRQENFSRGWYAGPLGYVGLDEVEFVVGIRSGVVKGQELSLYAGAGIVNGSKAQTEWQEIEHKISNFIKVIR